MLICAGHMEIIGYFIYFAMSTQKTNINCPLDTWLNAKICLPQQQRGLALAKITRDYSSGNYYALLSCDKSLLPQQMKQNQSLSNNILDGFYQNAIDNLSHLKPNTVLMFAPPASFGTKFWLAKVKKLVYSHVDALNNISQYIIEDLHEIDEFNEARRYPRIHARLEVQLFDSQNSEQIDFHTYNISQNGIAIINHSNYPFEMDKDYLIQIAIREGHQLPSLLYRVRNIRRDVITNADIVGMELVDSKSSDPVVQENMNLLTWTLK